MRKSKSLVPGKSRSLSTDTHWVQREHIRRVLTRQGIVSIKVNPGNVKLAGATLIRRPVRALPSAVRPKAIGPPKFTLRMPPELPRKQVPLLPERGRYEGVSGVMNQVVLMQKTLFAIKLESDEETKDLNDAQLMEMTQRLQPVLLIEYLWESWVAKRKGLLKKVLEAVKRDHPEMVGVDATLDNQLLIELPNASSRVWSTLEFVTFMEWALNRISGYQLEEKDGFEYLKNRKWAYGR